MRRQHWVTWLASALMCVMLATVAAAQSGTSTLQGKVADPQKAALPGATVTIANPATGLSRETTTDTSGGFTLPGMPPGTYVLPQASVEDMYRPDRFARTGTGKIVVQAAK